MRKIGIESRVFTDKIPDRSSRPYQPKRGDMDQLQLTKKQPAHMRNIHVQVATLDLRGRGDRTGWFEECAGK